MTEEIKESFLKEVDLHLKTNNTEHHTSEISVDQLIVRRGQPFNMTIKLTNSFNPQLHPLTVYAMTGQDPSQDRGTLSLMSVPDGLERSLSAKAVWKMELNRSSYPLRGILSLTITPPADAPIGEYIMNVKYKDEETLLAEPVVLFNPWCPEDSVFMYEEEQKQEYVMNEQGIIFKGSGNYIIPMKWDFGQFEESMVNICMRMLDLSHKHMEDPVADVSARSDPIYVSRVVSAMINSEDDWGVLVGNWGGDYRGGVSPSHWTGSYAILKKWFKFDFHPVKYGQCWVFAGVMCSVMRLLGIPCRVITNFESAHDTDGNLMIDVYHADYGVRERHSPDSVWNFHVWVEGWMKRPDLPDGGKYDGWQVVDPTPQELSDGVYCCGPASVKAILNGETDLKYDVPFVFAEVNADCVDWLVKPDGSKVKIWSDTKRVGQNISTKSVGSNKRRNITNTYKHREGSDKERVVFKYACTRDYSSDSELEETDEEVYNEETEEEDEDAWTEGNEETNETTESTDEETPEPPPMPPLSMRFKEVSKPVNGKDVSLKLVLHSKTSVARQLSINISVQAMMYNSTPVVNILTEVTEQTLQPGKELSIPIKVPFSVYKKHMLDRDCMKISALVMEKSNPENTFVAEHDVILLDPPISVTVSGPVKLNRPAQGEVVFENSIDETLTNCTLTLAGSGLLKEECECKLPDLKPNNRVRVKLFFTPYKTGTKTLMADFDCSTFRDIKGSCTVHVTE